MNAAWGPPGNKRGAVVFVHIPPCVNHYAWIPPSSYFVTIKACYRSDTNHLGPVLEPREQWYDAVALNFDPHSLADFFFHIL